MTSQDGHLNELNQVSRVFQMVAAIGFLFGLATLAGDTASDAEWRYLLYTTWFAVAVISLEAVIHRLKVGVYALVLATTTITIVDVISGEATLGGASLGILILYILLVYLRPSWTHFD